MEDKTDSDDALSNKNILIKEKNFSFNEEDLYDEPQDYQDFDKIEINSKNDNINNESKESLNLFKIDSKDENLNINSIKDKNNESYNDKDKSIMSEPNFTFKEQNSETYTESDNTSKSNININTKEEEIDIEINPELLTKFEKSFPNISSPNEFKKIYKFLKDKNYFELTIFEIMNIIQREISIKLTEYNYNNKEDINNYNNYLYNFPMEYININDPVYINNEHLQIMKLYKTMSIDEKNKYFEAKELTEEFFYDKEKMKKEEK